METISGTQMVIGLIIAIVLLVFFVLKTKIHAFLALIIAGSIAGIVGGMTPLSVADAITAGFGGTLASVGIVIGMGVMMGRILEVSGAAETLAYSLIRVVGKKKEEWAMAISGFVVSIPIFADSAYIILNSLVRSLSKKTGKSVVGLGVALAFGLMITHAMVPPTPGPIGVAGIFGVDIGVMLAWGIVLGIPILVVGVMYAKWIGKKIYQLPAETGTDYVRPKEVIPYPELLELMDDQAKNLPSLTRAILPIILPVILILMNTTLTALGLTEGYYEILVFLGHPVIAVAIGLIVSIYALAGDLTREDTIKRLEEGVQSAGMILLVTGAGGALGNVLRESGAGNFVAEKISDLPIPALLIPFFVAIVVRLVQGSGTVAMITSASVSAPILATLDVNMALAAQAACIGAFIFSYFNDSFFWVMNRMLGIDKVKEQMWVWTIPSIICGVVGLAGLLIANMFV